MNRYSYIDGADVNYIERLYKNFKKDPDSIDNSWKRFFEGFEYAESQNGKSQATATGPVAGKDLLKEFRVFRLIEAYRSRGHLVSDTNPIRERKDRKPHLNLNYFGLSESDLEEKFHVGVELGLGQARLKDIIDHLKKLYTRSLGVEYMHITNTPQRDWFQQRFENTAVDYSPPQDKKKQILHKLNEAVVFENFLKVKYPGEKRFGLEGGENTIPALDLILNKAGELGVKEVILGMAHRGRLNVLANIFGKTYEYIFGEFEQSMQPDLTMGYGDVKYHLGFSSHYTTFSGKEVHLNLMPNPSHLESVDPVVCGYTRAKRDLMYRDDFTELLPILIHGDAAIAGQGVIYEVVQMSKLKGFRTGGTLHFVINNQIGFTTDFHDARSSDYCTSVARVVNAPIIHVNGDDAEAVIYAVELATEFRMKFKRDVIVDMVCYRRHGHNEGDEPKYTQPDLYRKISKHPNPRKIYSDGLIDKGEIEGEMAKDKERNFKKMLQDRLNMAKQQKLPYQYQGPDQEWKNLRRAKTEDFEQSPDTGISRETMEKIIDAITHIPEGFQPIRKARKLLDQRREKFESNEIDWALAELFAYGSLLMEKKNVRISGQDSIRGTFSHRHAEIYDKETNEGYIGLRHLSDDQGQFKIYNSLLSEYAVLGFEYGYSLVSPYHLNIWEAQFGDFANGAQTIFDQYICSAERKWQKMSGVIVFLPHGYEGQGPEHSNARPERFLQLCAEENMIVCNCTTPANIFHVLRRQQAWPFRKPLIVFTPKSLLRHPRCVSTIEDIEKGGFTEVYDDDFVDPKEVTRVLLCTGKVYYELLEKQQEENIKKVAIVRLEQLYPLPEKKIDEIFAKYNDAEFYWVQEEPKNMGAWTFLLRTEIFRDRLNLLARQSSASTATGYKKVHQKEQTQLIEKAFETFI